ncbi:hypothetical protein GXP71_14650 [Cellulomonas sp. H30R-01]|uniref:hypothetical protein n=1 Tax=Cellulomonas sp. H30R-01 TaxID=2704467 RepID=UPI00138CE4D5|nr:hypothetical protein [Cellulomonas sp. H30R-01]QHT57194.1 hypothetical protein GXP71_14650 [Cellulomonas sp. H30R-01]
MTAELSTALVAAATSIVAATLAVVSARSARRSADDIDRRRHLVAAIDEDRRTFNDAYAGFMAAAGSVDGRDAMRAAMFAAQTLIVHPSSDRDVRDAAATVTNVMAAIVFRNGPSDPLNAAMERLTLAARAVNERMAMARSEAASQAAARAGGSTSRRAPTAA